MSGTKQIVVTGAAGFIGSTLVRKLNAVGAEHLILVDKFDVLAKNGNLQGANCTKQIDRDQFVEWFTEHAMEVEFVFHLGARTDTAEFNFRVLDSLNLSYSKSLWEICTIKQIPLLYASSAATYGMGEKGFADAHDIARELKPLNPYGLSKQLFDLFALEQHTAPPAWYGIKFFNVYGPYEFHKGRMASVAYHAFNQLQAMGEIKLFMSHRPEYKDGEQLRDFIFVDDAINICLFFYNQWREGKAVSSGIYNAGTGRARSFRDMVHAMFEALHKPLHLTYIPIPEDIRDKYQYYTQAETAKLLAAGYKDGFTILEDGIKAYVDFLGKNSGS